MNVEYSMPINHLIEGLGYSNSPSFIQPHSKTNDINFAHLYERAKKDCGLHGVYTCQTNNSINTIPIVYLCQTDNKTNVREIHKKVWNQDIVPILFIVVKKEIFLYNGFGFNPKHHEPIETISLNDIQEKLHLLSRESIDSGKIWQSDLWTNTINKSQRLDAHLLENLNILGNELVTTKKLDQEIAHSLIGKYIYLRYLRDRQFLSDKRLEEWKIAPNEIFTENATIKSFEKLNEILQDKLNGSIFPLQNEYKNKSGKYNTEHLQYVASIFFGNNPTSGQKALFDLYDFAFIPTELLSVIYEQFLHRDKEKAKDEGAYYTPLPLVNFVLNELEEKKPLTEKMRVLDPACGSGAFLVQTYRRLIQKTLQNNEKEHLKPKELKNLLTEHIYGIDIDRDACRVAQLGLLLTLLDNLEPTNLFGSDQFHLPKLDKNIVNTDTFNFNDEILQKFPSEKFDWIVGNPPWKELGQKSLAAQWIHANKRKYPVSNSIAEAFLWRSLDFSNEDTVIGLLLPAMTLFNEKSQKNTFRQHFFSSCDVWAIANLANLRQHLFAKAQTPCAVFFFRPQQTPLDETTIQVYSPLQINQIINRNKSKGVKNKSSVWNIIVNSNEIRYVNINEAVAGDLLVWKTAIWGSHRDLTLLQKMTRRFESFEEYAKKHDIIVHAGATPQKQSNTYTEFQPELINKKKIITTKFHNQRHIFNVSDTNSEVTKKRFCYFRKRDGNKYLEINKPPHIFLDKARRVAIYSDDYFIVPARELGIAGKKPHILKALALYFCSDFFRYHQFFLAPEWGISRAITILDTLKKLPMPLEKMSDKDITEWADLYKQLQDNARSKKPFSEKQNKLLFEANKRINKVLGLRDSEQLLINDFLNYKMNLIDGGIDNDLITPCDKNILTNYTKQLKKSLDSFFDEEDNIHHDVTVLNTNNKSMAGVRIDFIKNGIKTVKSKTTGDFDIPINILKLITTRHSQWLYFQRELRIYDNQSIFVFKPNEKINWLESQALVDSDNIINEILAMEGELNNEKY